MSCSICHAFAIPDSDPQICPECFMKRSTRSERLNVGVKEGQLTKEQVHEHHYPSEFELEAFTFHLSDFDDLVKVDKFNGMVYALIERDVDDYTWVTWSEYQTYLLNE